MADQDLDATTATGNAGGRVDAYDDDLPLVVPVATVRPEARDGSLTAAAAGAPPAAPTVREETSGAGAPADARPVAPSMGALEHGADAGAVLRTASRGVEPSGGQARPASVTAPGGAEEPAAATIEQPTTPSVAPEGGVAASAAAPAPAMRPPLRPTREEELAQALDELLEEDPDVHAAALVSLDGFTMASALPSDLQPDRVGAMSAAILALGERASAELGRGSLSQVFIEGEDGYVLLVAAGSWAVLTAIADPSAKLGLVIYDMKRTAERIGRILG